MELQNVTAVAEANVYFEGRVISHTVITADGARKTLGVVLPGDYHFDTAAAERMEIVQGACEIVITGTNQTDSYQAGDAFEIPADSGFHITVTGRPCHYICSFL
ncbi:MAG: pyrimidine/purine nucleoside phosphorylase [Verrucomicrobiota bacterium]